MLLEIYSWTVINNTGSLNKDSGFSVAAQGVRKGSNSLFGCWAETRTKMWPTVSELETPSPSWLNGEEGIQRLRETGISECVCHFRPTHSH